MANKKAKTKKITLNEYLSNFNKQRVLDNIIRKWYFKKDKLNPTKTKEQWDKIMYEFHNETDNF